MLDFNLYLCRRQWRCDMLGGAGGRVHGPRQLQRRAQGLREGSDHEGKLRIRQVDLGSTMFRRRVDKIKKFKNYIKAALTLNKTVPSVQNCRSVRVSHIEI